MPHNIFPPRPVSGTAIAIALAVQATLRETAEISGLGLHTGTRVNIRLVPAPPATGLVFRRTDLNNFQIEASTRHVAKLSYATTLMKRGVLVSTVEHLLSALYGLRVDNLYIELDSIELPIIDGSALEFVRLIEEAGLEYQPAGRQMLRVLKPVEVRRGEKWIGIYPDDAFTVEYEIEFEHPAIGRQRLELEITPESYRQEIAPARTFGFYQEAQALLRSGLIRGGSLENAIVLDSTGVLNDHLRFPDEFVRHKILDLIGDLSLLGAQLLGRVRAFRAGHALHAALIARLLKEPDAYRIEREEAGARLKA